MNLSKKWLKEYVDISGVETRDFAEAMTLSGSKVEGTSILSDTIKNVAVGRVLSISRHEDSDHMWVCQIDIGGSTVQIVTGAQNVKEGDLVPVAKDGSLLPDGKEICSGSLRGVESCGMLCSLSELGLSLHDYPEAQDDGIWIIKEPGAAPGDDIGALIGLDDEVVEFEITPNRPDCLSVIGLARETAATFKKPLMLHTPEIRGCGGDINDHAKIEIVDGKLCPRYTARLVKNVKIAPSPPWMRERLRNSGVRPINNIVDITNYVMLEYGQPMHAFDFSCVDGGHIIIRTARDGETIQTLDGNDRKLTPSMLCICDENRPVCVAGVMGGANSEIVGDTDMVLFESANFNGVSVRRTATALGMRTDASSHYEKGLDPANTIKAVQRACELVEALGAGEVIDGVIDALPNEFKPTVLTLDPRKINALLGTDISEAQMREILESLGFELDGEHVRVPSWRSDVEAACDLAEEIARFYGYDNIPSTLLSGETTLGSLTEAQVIENTLGTACRALGYDEIITYSFISPSDYDKIRMPEASPLRKSMTILNPLGEDRSIMRTTVLPSMMDILSRNFNYRNASARLYELGKTYFAREDGLADEPKVLSLGVFEQGMDFYKLKGEVEAVLASLKIKNISFEAESENPAYHPGRAAKVFSGGARLGTLGQIHPLVAQNYDAPTEFYCAELSLDALIGAYGGTHFYTPLPKFPSISRDIAVVVSDSVSVGALTKTISENGGKYLTDCKFFDIYKGSHIEAGFKSVAFSLTLRSDEATLKDEDAAEAVTLILDALKTAHGAVIR